MSTLAFPVPPKEWAEDVLLARQDLLFLQTAGSKDRIAAVHIRRGAGRTILYSHGNAEDLGLSLPYLDQMAEVCKADIFSYDYCGYGVSEGSPSEDSCYEAIDAAYLYLKRVGVDPSRIVAFGRSIGSGPTVDLVSRSPEIRGMVLQSPLESGGRAVFGNVTAWVGYRLDIFKNYEKIDKIKCPVLIMHGTNDSVVPWSNGRALYDACERPVEPFWVNGKGHNDMPDRQCLMKVYEFLNGLNLLPARDASSKPASRPVPAKDQWRSA